MPKAFFSHYHRLLIVYAITTIVGYYVVLSLPSGHTHVFTSLRTRLRHHAIARY